MLNSLMQFLFFEYTKSYIQSPVFRRIYQSNVPKQRLQIKQPQVIFTTLTQIPCRTAMQFLNMIVTAALLVSELVMTYGFITKKVSYEIATRFESDALKHFVVTN